LIPSEPPSLSAAVGPRPIPDPFHHLDRLGRHDRGGSCSPYSGVPVTTRTKVIEVDPRNSTAEVRGISERPRRIAEGVLAAIRAGASHGREPR
jgi:hypothetical protein